MRRGKPLSEARREVLDTVFHAGNDFTTVSRVMPELTEMDIRRL
ncbi:hypothetical protein NRB56_32670 [Nocardia sp. RB56]|uniref:Uncharacterized protein n=1 Tax=Nocardia aurantia TaxID=2585199 RepID=A0A7K0DS82_9NOCA|nr:hypothetical protein [Nocardia aurantia]